MARRNFGGIGLTLGGVVLAGGLAYLLLKKKSQPLAPDVPPVVEPSEPPAPVPAPIPSPYPTPPTPPTTPVPTSVDIEFEGDGEEFLTLPEGAEFTISWDPLSPWRYGIEDSEVLEAVEIGDSFVRFRVMKQIEKGAFYQAYVLALGETDDEVLGIHKVTVFGP